MLLELIRPDIDDMIRRQAWDELRSALAGLTEQDIAELIVDLEGEGPVVDEAVVFRMLPRDRAGLVFSYLPLEHQEELIQSLSAEQSRDIFAGLAPDDRVDLLDELPAEVTRRLLETLPAGDLAATRQILAYPDETAGHFMTPSFITLRPTMTAAEALEHIRRAPRTVETANVLYVVGPDGKLLRDLRLATLVRADPQTLIGDIDDRPLVTVNPHVDREEVVRSFQKYDRVALPVVDDDGRMLGIITIDDVIDVQQAEATEDFHRMAAVIRSDMNLRTASLWILYRIRVPWLLVLVFMNIFSGAGIAYFEDTIAAAVALVFFLPLLIDSGGNAGSQSATLMIRALAVGDVQLRDWFRLIRREVLVALVIGVTLGLAVSPIGIFRADFDVAVVVAMSMVCVVVVASIVGMSLPFILTRLRLDPAAASAPLVTSLADISGVLIYFAIATWYLRDRLGGDDPTIESAVETVIESSRAFVGC